MRKAKDTVDGRFTTHEYDNNQNIPLFRYTVIEDSPHSYMPEVSEMVWNDFFSHFSLNADGSRSYDGVQVKRNAVFADAKGHWAQNAIENTVAEGLFSGVTDTSFAPNASATRGMLMTVLARYAGTDTTGGATWYEKGMEWAVANGIVNGSNGKLNPQNNATRAEVAAILMRFCEMSK